MHDSSNLCLEGETLRQGAHTRKKKYMQVVFDNMFYYSPCAHTKAVCHLKVLVGNSVTLTIATEVPQGYAWSIARSPEILAAYAINAFQLNPAITKYIEHYPAPEKPKIRKENTLVRPIEAYFLVNFTWQVTNEVLVSYKASQPQRQVLSIIDFVRLIRTVYTSKRNHSE